MAVTQMTPGAIRRRSCGAGPTAKGKSDEAVLASRAAICVAQFMRAPNHDEQLKALEQTDSWKRSELIEKGGWDKMPGQEEASGAVADACARGLEILAENDRK